MSSRWWAFALWALAAGCAVFWGLRLFVPGRPAPAETDVAAPAVAPRGDLTRLFGVDAPAPVAVAEAPPPQAANRFQLLGVVAPRGGAGEGVALIAVDGKTPRAYKVGATVDGDTVLKAVRLRAATLGPRSGNAAAVTLEIPPLPPPATGVPGGAMGAAPAPVLSQAVPQPMPMPQPLGPGGVPPPAAVITPVPQQGQQGLRPVLPNNYVPPPQVRPGAMQRPQQQFDPTTGGRQDGAALQ